ncbi:VapE domain-containing protein [Anaerotignum propionicum]|uniref:Predicted P-loop ATPase and inactivated derivatives n=1 Tax=Anaerotignum propionicum DSM 1682 TaxID=991789 RepID=A0A120MK72_ANAPI|nr:VapE domain-containing protein [Anaerotignum propionicum]AMJ40358.1 virulence-associated protein E [Anaerotignum propionicum DSM 1682]SHE44210.1 Predicted P-loop ATPase and inactivated derivatives [[Clostridium] propionicum DSM 1682] [Anaerotignum propionicum DSM 1682]
MQNDRQITISTAGSRKATNWQPQTMRIAELFEKLRTPLRGKETLSAYMSMKKHQQDELKDVGGFIGGNLTGRRKKGAVLNRDVITLDMDNCPPESTKAILQRLSSLGMMYAVYSTRKHSPAAPRLRVVVPTDRKMLPEEYEPIARKLAALVQPEMHWFDPTTFQVERLMYWPSCCVDSEYIFTYEDKPLLSADGMLGTYENWLNVASWPQVPGEQKLRERSAAKQGDPTEKKGTVGAFCRIYSVVQAMDTFLPGVYAPTEQSDRYTFVGGSTTGGAIIYDDEKFLFSHHASDPCSGQLVNAFDLVRLHLFGEQDDEAKEGTPTNKLPSYDLMCRKAIEDKDVLALLQKERMEQAETEFKDIQEGFAETEDTLEWMRRLRVHPKTGLPESTIDNVWIILENDRNLKGKFAINEFAGRGEILGALPWNTGIKRRFWDDNDNQGLYWYLEKSYRISGAAKIDGALSLHSNKNSFNDVTKYLKELKWDGVPRLDTLLIDYLGAEDSIYTRAVTRKAFTAAVARAYIPGFKFDYMTIFTGPQGIGKSTLLAKMSKGWFNDSIRTFEGKEASELLQGVWLVEVGELDAFNRSDVGRIKQFLSQQADRFRAAYGRHVKEMPRRCVFFGTTNDAEFLTDRTGNRRFWPLVVGARKAKKSVWADLDNDLDQLWAEAAMRFKIGEPLYLSGEVEKAAKEQQESHRKTSTREGIISDFLEQKVPADWLSWKLEQRRMFWEGNAAFDGELVPRKKVCALEVWCEALGCDQRMIKNSDTAEINSIISSVKGWSRLQNPQPFGYCKNQRGFKNDQLQSPF